MAISSFSMTGFYCLSPQRPNVTCWSKLNDKESQEIL